MIVTDITKIGDPEIILYEGKYYCYATSSSHYTNGFSVWTSTDLKNWEGPHPCFDAIDYWGKSHFWAPEVVYHGGKFIMHYSAMSRELDSLRIGVATSDSPLGPFVDVHGEPMFDFGYAAIDGSVLICPEGNFLYFSRDCSENKVDGVNVSQIYAVKLDETLTKTIGDPTLIATPTEEYEMHSLSEFNTLWNEGPTVIPYKDGYLMNYSANCYARNTYAICAATSKSPLGPWKKSTNNPVLSMRGDLFGAGHNAFFKDKEGKLWTSFHVQTNPESPSGDRRVVLGEVRISEKLSDVFLEII